MVEKNLEGGDELAIEEKPAAKSFRPRATAAPVRVLVVEDNATHAHLVKALLTGLEPGFELDFATRLQTALMLLGTKPFDAILLDLHLPDSEGFDTVRLVHERAPSVPIVVHSGSGDDEMVRRALETGVQDYIVKGETTGPALARTICHAIVRKRAQTNVLVPQGPLERLRTGLSRLAAGDFTVRLAGDSPASAKDDPAQPTLETFDRAVEALAKKSWLNTQFHSMAAHDMRSPLGTILLAANRLESGEGVDRERCLALIRMATRRQLGMVESVLDLYTLQSGGLTVWPEWVDVNKVLLDCATELSRQAEMRNQLIEVKLLAGDPMVWCDPARVYSVLDNLVVNALKYSLTGDTIRIGCVEDGTGLLRFEVVDHGPGIPEPEQARVFEWFKQGESTASRGAGLGLAICKAVVEAHGGKIEVQSDPGAGCRFVFTLQRQPPIPQLGASRE